jgi:predicted RNase H-like HicB family nuclease
MPGATVDVVRNRVSTATDAWVEALLEEKRHVVHDALPEE